MSNGQRTEPAGLNVVNVPRHHRYEISRAGERAGLTAYLDRGDQRIFYHTEIDERFAGQGLAGKLVASALADTRAEGKRIVAVCPFVAKYVKNHHDFDDVLDPVTPDILEAVRASVEG